MTSEESLREIRITTSHEVFYRSAWISGESREVSGNCWTISRRESIKKYEMVPWIMTDDSTDPHKDEKLSGERASATEGRSCSETEVEKCVLREETLTVEYAVTHE